MVVKISLLFLWTGCWKKNSPHWVETPWPDVTLIRAKNASTGIGKFRVKYIIHSVQTDRFVLCYLYYQFLLTYVIYLHNFVESYITDTGVTVWCWRSNHVGYDLKDWFHTTTTTTTQEPCGNYLRCINYGKWEYKVFLAATKQLYKWYFPSVSPSVRLSVCPSVRLSVCHTFLTMFPSWYHHEIFRSYYQWQK